ncbi:MAG: DEAD/DEAH box helicase [Solirubrobacterales bacterium]|nr:DEAD/DEAH box helicase [Solirubrobacterales bacterium]
MATQQRLHAVPDEPNVQLRETPTGEHEVVLSFPYNGHIVAAVRTLPDRRFDWDLREWTAPATDWCAARLGEILNSYPELTRSAEFDAWFAQAERRWVGHVRTARYNGTGHWALDTLAGRLPPGLQKLATAAEDGSARWLVPMTSQAATALRELREPRFSIGAARCLDAIEAGDEDPPPARLILTRSVAGERFALETYWDPDIAAGFEQLPGARAGELKLDPWIADQLDEFVALHQIALSPAAAEMLADLATQNRAAHKAVSESRATKAEPLELNLGGELQPFQWAAVRYALEHRQTFLADEQGLGKTVEALATLEAADAFPAVVICPASMKLTWAREATHWLGHRDVAVIQGRSGSLPRADITILNYEVVEAHRETLQKRGLKALVADESHYCKNPQAKRTRAVRRLAESVADDGLRLALTGTPVLNHADELIAQLRVIGRLKEFGSGASFSRQFEGEFSEERLHWHLRRHCFVRRLKSEVLPQLPAKRQIVVPVSLNNEAEYRLAEDDVIEWLKTQPLELEQLDAKIAATLRAERLAQLTALQRLAARGKLAAALSWIHDFLASGEPLVLFARHREIQRAVLERFPDAVHILGEDSAATRDRAVRAFQDPDGPQLIVGATRAAAQGITLTRASNVCFLELEWTPAIHDQAEDRCHRIGQRDAVSAWYLLAADTIDETMARLIKRKREIVDAVTDGHELPDGGLVEGVIRELREGQPFRHLRAVAGDSGVDAKLAGDANAAARRL